MADLRVNGFTRLTYLDGEELLLPRSAYEGLNFAIESCRVWWVGQEIDGCDVRVRLSEVREVLDVTAQTYAQWKAEEVTGGGN